MAIPIITEMPEDLLTETATGYRAGRNFSIIAFSAVDAKIVLFQQKGIQRGVVYQNSIGTIPDPTLRCSSVEVESRTQPGAGATGLYHVKAVYDTVGNVAEPIADGPPAYNWTAGTSVQPIDMALSLDNDDDEPDLDKVVPILNSAGEPFDPPVQESVATMLLTIEWYKSSFSVVTQRKFQNAINRETWNVNDGSYAPPNGEAWIRTFVRQKIRDGLIRLYLEAEIKPKIKIRHLVVGSGLTVPSNSLVSQFNIIRADMGRRTKEQAIYRRIHDEDGADVKDPVFLDGKGGKLASQSLTDAVFLVWKNKPLRNFNQLGV